MKTLRAFTLACVLLLSSITAFAGEGVLTPGADKTPPPPPPPTSMTATSEAAAETDENVTSPHA